jgi:hypothetical protein
MVCPLNKLKGIEMSCSECGELPMLIRRCLAYGIKILPYKLEAMMAQYEKTKIPDDVVSRFNDYTLLRYIEGLYLSSQEMAVDWTRGYAILKELGFTEIEREEGHRKFVRLMYKT